MRDMQSPQGGYYSSLDADSEHEEGKFYVWTPEQVASLLSVEEYAIVAAHYGLDHPPNFENRHWNLIVAQPLATIAEARQLPLEQIAQQLASAQKQLFDARANRVRPGRDEKILVSWNALRIQGMARAGRRLGESEGILSARRAGDAARWVVARARGSGPTHRPGSPRRSSTTSRWVSSRPGSGSTTRGTTGSGCSLRT